MVKRFLFLCLVATWARDSSAALTCYNDSLLPSVETVGRVNAVVVIRFAEPGPPPFRWSGEKWIPYVDAPTSRRDRLRNCPAVFSKHNYGDLTDFEHATPTIACSRDGETVYGGISFYDGEGVSGRGALLRLAARGEVERRRPPEVEGRSVSGLAVRNGMLWFGTTRHEECTGNLFGHGLVRYEWNTGTTVTYEGSDGGPLGFVVNDLLLDGDVLWVATDLGISRLQIATNLWRHWAAEGSGDKVIMEETSPEELYRHLLDTVPKSALMTDSYENQLVEALARFRPRFLQRYLAEQTARSWDCASARFLGSRMRGFGQFYARVARHLDGRERTCAIEGFSLTQNREAAWRDYLLTMDLPILPDGSAHRGPLPASVFREFRGDAAVERHLLARLDDDTVTVLPLVMGPRSIPILRKEPDQLSAWGTVRERVIYALELATHRRILPDGTVEILPNGSDRPWYVDLVPRGDSRYRWSGLNPEDRNGLAQRWREALDQKRFSITTDAAKK